MAKKAKVKIEDGSILEITNKSGDELEMGTYSEGKNIKYWIMVSEYLGEVGGASTMSLTEKDLRKIYAWAKKVLIS